MNIKQEINLSSVAKTLHDLLQKYDEWHLSYNEGADNFETSEAKFAALTMEQNTVLQRGYIG